MAMRAALGGVLVMLLGVYACSATSLAGDHEPTLRAGSVLGFASFASFKGHTARRVGRGFSVCMQEKKVVLVCTGDACEDVGARQLLKHARATIPGELQCKSTGCLGMCGQGPVVGVEVTPGGAVEVKRDVTEEALEEIFAEALESAYETP
mmetsp:Transcript_34199/g.80218  ORF Transcript_34199/g.80218 Transcript_34199/m.80218 type:complete len:151 (+) Transcript_34199:79-531(+)